MLFTIITPTTGNPAFSKLLASLNAQTNNANFQYEHYVVIDGPAFQEKTELLLRETPAIHHTRYLFQLPFNTGGIGHNGDAFLGHKIYAAITQFVKGDYVILLDEDNWIDPDYLQICYNTIHSTTPPLQWCFSLRKIVSLAGEYICNDDCESLGFLHPMFYSPENDHMIDTNCTCVSREIAVQLSAIWNRIGTSTNTNPDRIYSNILMTNFQNYDCTYTYSINYRVANRGSNSVSADLFLQGNQVILSKFGGKIPWSLPNRLVVAHFDYYHTDQLLSRVYCVDKPTIAYNQWQLNLLDAFSDRFLMSAYNRYIPANSSVLVHMCDPTQLPIALLERTDMAEKILYTAEGPNARHADQWSPHFLQKYFTKIFTYWMPPGTMRNIEVVYTPFIHRFDFGPTSVDKQRFILINQATPAARSICIVLENRPTTGWYPIHGTQLYSLDSLRLEYARNLGKRIHCYGRTWESMQNIIQYCPAKDRMLDQEYVVDIMNKYTFALIIENCNASGYVSEKIYDAFAAGCIPLYFGNIIPELDIPAECYVDLTKISPSDLPKWLDSLSEDTITSIRAQIYYNRERILKRVSINAYAETLKQNQHKQTLIV